MAEFKEVAKNARRLCKSRKLCNGCPLSLADEVCWFDSLENPYIDMDLEKMESIVMQWAKEHPENEYPTWIDWQQKVFPTATTMICPKIFISKEEANCFGKSCFECTHSPIPKEIAEKLGIKPLKGE